MQSGDAQTLVWLINRLKCCGPWTVLARGAYRERLWIEMSRAGIGSLGILSAISAAVGIILALQAAVLLVRVDATSHVATLVGITITREVGPLLTAIIMIGRSGATFAAETASLSISEEMEALKDLGFDPVAILVWPKLLGLVLVMPCLTVWADLVGIMSSGVFSSLAFQIDITLYFERTVNVLRRWDLIQGMVKSLWFAAAVTIASCWEGFLAKNGAAEVGIRTTMAVVRTIFAIIVLDLIFAGVNYLID